jgi:hypothetical protein
MRTNLKNMAKIAINKSLLKEYSNDKYSRIVYMRDNTEFQIQLFNPHNFTVGIDIFLNDKSLGNKIILRPGERLWLERYLDSPQKFLYNTYFVNGDNKDVQKAIENNGDIVLKFYKEKENYNEWWNNYPKATWTYYKNEYPDWLNKTSYKNNHYDYNTSITNGKSDINIYNSTCDCNLNYSSLLIDSNYNAECTAASTISDTFSTKTPLETGRVERGNYSNQKFNDISINLENYPFKTEVIKILPESQKQYTNNDLKKIYCYNCGHKLKDKFKYCPYCGAKV